MMVSCSLVRMIMASPVGERLARCEGDDSNLIHILMALGRQWFKRFQTELPHAEDSRLNALSTLDALSRVVA